MTDKDKNDEMPLLYSFLLSFGFMLFGMGLVLLTGGDQDHLPKAAMVGALGVTVFASWVKDRFKKKP